MFEAWGNLFEAKADAIVIPTNGDVNRKGLAIMGRGVALQAKHRYPGIDAALALRLKGGNNVYALGMSPDGWLVSFPVKHHWQEEADPSLIDLSCGQLVALTNEKGWSSVVLPRTGCGNGRLDWMMVRPILAAWLDSRFTVINDGR